MQSFWDMNFSILGNTQCNATFLKRWGFQDIIFALEDVGNIFTRNALSEHPLAHSNVSEEQNPLNLHRYESRVLSTSINGDRTFGIMWSCICCAVRQLSMF